jgi:hypothetical protein
VGEPEKTEVDAIEQMKAEIKRRREATKTVEIGGVKTTGLLRSSGRSKPKAEEPVKAEMKTQTIGETLEEIMPGGAGATKDKKTTIDERVEEIMAGAGATKSKDEADDEEGLKAEAPVLGTDLNLDEERERRLIRWKKLKQINAKYAVVRSYGGKCAVVTIGQSKIDPDRKIYEFQTQDAFDVSRQRSSDKTA